MPGRRRPRGATRSTTPSLAAQADASGTANALYFSYARLGVPCWLTCGRKADARGHAQGVRDSDVFLLVLSKHVLAGGLSAGGTRGHRREEKVQILLEEDPRFLPFDVEAWEASRTAPPSDKDLRTSMGKTDAQIASQRRRAADAAAADDGDEEANAHAAIASLRLEKTKMEAMLGSQEIPADA